MRVIVLPHEIFDVVLAYRLPIFVFYQKTAFVNRAGQRASSPATFMKTNSNSAGSAVDASELIFFFF